MTLNKWPVLNFYDEAVLSGPRVQETSPFCKLTLWLFIDDESNTELGVFFRNASVPTLSWLERGSPLARLKKTVAGTWMRHEVNIGRFKAGHHLQLIAWPDSEKSEFHDVAVDDVSFTHCYAGERATDSAALSTLNCEFDTNFCDYFMDTDSDFWWTRNSRATRHGTGPQFSRSGSDGGGDDAGLFAYFSTIGSNRRTGNVARFYSPIQTLVGRNVCLRFWYFIYGTGIGQLNVYVDQHERAPPANASEYDEDNHERFNRTLVWRRSTSQGARWLEAQRTIWSDRPWKVTFEGVVGRMASSDLAIDSIRSYSDACPPPSSCDFEVDMCDYAQYNDDTPQSSSSSSSSKIEWQRGVPNKQAIDHTTLSNQGHFIYATGSGTARLVSPTYTATGLQCLQFWYLLDNSDGKEDKNSNATAMLNVRVKRKNRFGSTIDLAWTRSARRPLSDGVSSLFDRIVNML